MPRKTLVENRNAESEFGERRVVETSDQHSVVVDLSGFDRIRSGSRRAVNARVSSQIEEKLKHFSTQDRAALDREIDRLDREWDIDRAVMIFVSIGGLLALSLGLGRDRRFLRALGVQLPVLALHSMTGWSPPAILLRQLGFRSRSEIDAEKYALKTLRGDFRLQSQRTRKRSQKPTGHVSGNSALSNS